MNSPVYPADLHWEIISSLKFQASIKITSGFEFNPVSKSTILIFVPEYKFCFIVLLSIIKSIFFH